MADGVKVSTGRQALNKRVVEDAQKVIQFDSDLDLVNTMVGSYRLMSKLGQGGMATVYRAEQVATKQQVALKVMILKENSDKNLAEQIFHEASALATIRHPNVITCYGFGEDRGRLYMALEIISGGDALDLLDQYGEHRIPEQILLRTCMDAARGLQAVHNAGFIHRDIKPSNLFISAEGRIKVADFGLVWRDENITTVKGLQGTPSYMSPEQVRNDDMLTEQTDVWSLGASVFHLATGFPPFRREDPWKTISAVINDELPNLRKLCPHLSDGFVEVVNRCLDKNCEHRYENTRELLADLEEVKRRLPPTFATQRIEKKESRDNIPAVDSAVKEGSSRIVAGSGSTASRKTAVVRPVTDRTDMSPSPMKNPIIWAAVVIIILLVVIVVLLLNNGKAAPVRSGSGQNIVQQTAVSPAVVQVQEGLLPQAGKNILELVSTGLEGLKCDGGQATVYQDAANMISAIRAGNDMSVQVEFAAHEAQQIGPARIFSIGLNAYQHNIVIGQQGDGLEIWLRTTLTSLNGQRPHVVVANGIISVQQRHVVTLVRSGGIHHLWVDGQKIKTIPVPGDLSNWDEKAHCTWGAEAEGETPWAGTVYKTYIWSRALTDEEIINPSTTP